MKNVFIDKAIIPTKAALQKALGPSFSFWEQIIAYTHASVPKATEEWKYSGEKIGWSFRVSDSKRVIVYLMPFEKSFQVSMVFGPKAIELIVASNISKELIDELKQAGVYAEGSGIRIQVSDNSMLEDIKQLINFKLLK